MDTKSLIDKCKDTCSPPTYVELARRLDVKPSAVSNWTHGRAHPDAVSCAKIAEITGIPLARVLGIVGEARAISREEKAVWRRLASAAIVALSMLPLVTIAATNSPTLTEARSMHYAKYRERLRESSIPCMTPPIRVIVSQPIGAHRIPSDLWQAS